MREKKRKEKAWREGEKEGRTNEERKKEEQENEKKKHTLYRTPFKSNRAQQERFYKVYSLLSLPTPAL